MHGSIHLFDRLPQVDSAGAAPQPGVAAPVRARPLVGLIRNPRSHRNEAGRSQRVSDPNIILRMPDKRSELPAILEEFARERVDYIAIDGGDGTVRDVLTCGAGQFGESWPALIVLPSGKTNALAHDLGIPADWSVADAIAAARQGNVVMRRPMVVSQRGDDKAQVRGFVLGAGAFTHAVTLGQDAHRFGAFNSAAVAVTTAWSALQALFGSAGNKWRKPTRMYLADEDGRAIESHAGRPDERYLLLASTLYGFPAGLDPFRSVTGRIRFGVLDTASRRVLSRLPMLMRGKITPATRNRGAHVHGVDAMQFDIGDSFILDGEAFPAGQYRITAGRRLRFIVP